MITLNNKLILSATLLLAPAVHAASPAADFAMGVAGLTAATAVAVAGYNRGPSRQAFETPTLDSSLEAAFYYPVCLFTALKLAQYGHSKIDSATSRSSLLKRFSLLGNGAVSAALFYNFFIKPYRETDSNNPFVQETGKDALVASTNALATYGLVTWGYHLLNNAYHSFDQALKTEKTA